jgi:transcription-repair coupling factor (superfamily II helicase)
MPASLNPVYPKQTSKNENTADFLHWQNLHGCSQDLLIAKTAQSFKGLTLAITADMNAAYQLEHNLKFFAGDATIQIFPDWETLPYDVFSPLEDIISDRLNALYHLPRSEKMVLIIPITTLMQRLPPPSFIESHSLILKTGDCLDIELLREQLEKSGYRHVSQVIEHGEYASRGSLVDLFPMGSDTPYRIDFFDDEIETIRRFSPEDQRTIEKLDSIELLPANEFPLDEKGIRTFRQNYRLEFSGDTAKSIVYQNITDGNPIAGIEYYLPLFFDETASLFDYLPQKTLLFIYEDTADAASQYWAKVSDRYEQRRHDIERPILPPEKLWLAPEALEEKLTTHRRVYLHHQSVLDDQQHAYATRPLPAMLLQARSEHPLLLLQQFLATHKGKVIFTADSAGKRENLIGLLHDNGIKTHTVENWQEAESSRKQRLITVAPIQDGLWLPDDKLAVIPDSLILGIRIDQQRKRRKTRDADAIIRNLTDLSEGAPVVHEEHGVGRYLGLITLETGDIEGEYLLLEYAGGDRLYVPVASLHLISRYTGTSPDSAPLHKLGTDAWERAKKKAAQKAYDVAAELLEVHAKREALQGQPLDFSEVEYATFANDFPFEETPDQSAAIAQTLKDMHSGRPMDRVVCGDVGFGKTEVAMRAAFAAANAGKQVAMIAPTTLLVGQHTQNFQDRFADWPFVIESLSRFKTGKQTKEALEKLESGYINIVIGTHKLLQPDIKFKDLGLVIVDEEHRFGVRHKEQLKKLRANVDMLTLTATPIPRTLNMSLSGIRDLSIIATPPVQRHAIKTFITEWDKNLIQEACAREISRGGQVYFLHNEVKSIAKTTKELQEILPDAQVRFAHGQMPERELEGIIQDFYHQRFHVLIATTIIESGIDIPTANTIIINRADKLGLAQLHQIRGRVGRSHHRAYAYLITPPKKTMTADAVKRLEALASLEDLGVGFTLATHDLEIRGAGELLGEDQSGQIQEIGFNLYNELLERAVKAMKSGQMPDTSATDAHVTTVDIGAPALIPTDYIPDVHSRLILYKRIASTQNSEELKELRIEMIDRFGLLPDEVNNLFEVTRLRQLASAIGIKKLDASDKGGRIIFDSKPKVNPAKIIELVQKRPWTYRLDGQDKLRFEHEMSEVDGRIDWLKTLINTIKLENAH